MSVKPYRGLALAALVVAVPLFGPSAANAAMGGANAGTTTLRPDLRSAAITNVAPTSETTIQVCFNKDITTAANAGSFRVGNYRQDERTADSASRSTASPNCADVLFSSSDIDATKRTYVSVDAGAVANAANGQFNLDDSTSLVGSDTHNGTRGHAVPPDLEGVTTNVGTNEVNFVFDQNIAFAAGAGFYSVTQQDGTTVFNTGASFSGNVVTATFPTNALGTAGNPAVRGTVEPFAVTEKTANAINSVRMSGTVPGTGGFTNNPDLLSATLASDGSYVDYTFDDNIFLTVAPAGAFRVGLSDGSFLDSPATPDPAVTVVNGNTVRVKFDNLANVNEYAVWAHVDPGAVQSILGGTNAGQGVPTGGNAGAFANGFTTAPEALTVAFDTTANVVNILLDQRFTQFSVGQIKLIDDAGAVTAFNPISVGGAGGPAGQVVAQAQFAPGQIAGARSVQLLPDAFFGGSFFSSPGLYGNVQQIISPTAAAHFTRKNGRIVRHAARGVSRKSLARGKALKRSFGRVR